MDSINHFQGLEIINAVLTACTKEGIDIAKISHLDINIRFISGKTWHWNFDLPETTQAMIETVSDLTPPPVPSTNGTDCTSQCALDILATLEETGRRLTTSELSAEMEKKERIWGESTLRGWLARLVKEKRIDNVPGGRQYRGYGFPGWMIPVALAFRLFCEELLRSWCS